jgi:uncharacterized membrane protein
MSQAAARNHSALTPERFKALADGVFSIALTLLIIDVVAAAKDMEHGAVLADHLMHHWGTGVAYLVGFLTIFVCWVNHHAVLEQVERVDRGFLWIGGLQLGLVSAVPLPTALLADHFGGDSSHTAFAIYGVTFLLMAFSFWALSRTVLRHGLLREGADTEGLAKLVRAYFVAVLWNVLCLLALRVNLFIALPMWGLMFGVFAFPGEFADLLHGKRPARG